MSSRQWDRALETALQWLAQDPNNVRAHIVAGQSLVNLKRYSEAEPHLGRALQGNPNNHVVHRFMSILQFHTNRFKKAEESIHKALSLNPRDPYHWYHLGWMLYKQGDSTSARKYIEKARELSPRDAIILNLLALCTPKKKANAGEILRQYHEALEIDPQNSQIHNNIGHYYLSVEKDYPAAEGYFRRALFFDPTSKVARSNLFIVLKRRDTVYRVLCAPRDFVFKTYNLLRAGRRRSILLYILILPLWILVFRYVLVVLALWFLLVWPMVKSYEYLTLGDLRTQAGDIGAKRGGIFGYRRWPLRIRLALFALLLLIFWGGITLFIVKSPQLRLDENLQAIFGFLIMAGLILVAGFWGRGKWKRRYHMFRSRKKVADIDRMLERKPNRPSTDKT